MNNTEYTDPLHALSTGRLVEDTYKLSQLADLPDPLIVRLWHFMRLEVVRLYYKCYYALQRLFRGYADPEVFDLCGYIAQYTAPRLKALIEADPEWIPLLPLEDLPYQMQEELEDYLEDLVKYDQKLWEFRQAHWKYILETMLYGLENIDEFCFDEQEQCDKRKLGIKYFEKYWRALWL